MSPRGGSNWCRAAAADYLAEQSTAVRVCVCLSFTVRVVPSPHSTVHTPTHSRRNRQAARPDRDKAETELARQPGSQADRQGEGEIV